MFYNKYVYPDLKLFSRYPIGLTSSVQQKWAEMLFHVQGGKSTSAFTLNSLALMALEYTSLYLEAFPLINCIAGL